MHTLEQIEEEVKSLLMAEQKTLLYRLVSYLSKTGELLTENRKSQLSHFFMQWDANHSLTVGDKPTRAGTYADNSRLH